MKLIYKKLLILFTATVSYSNIFAGVLENLCLDNQSDYPVVIHIMDNSGKPFSLSNGEVDLIDGFVISQHFQECFTLTPYIYHDGFMLYVDGVKSGMYYDFDNEQWNIKIINGNHHGALTGKAMYKDYVTPYKCDNGNKFCSMYQIPAMSLVKNRQSLSEYFDSLLPDDVTYFNNGKLYSSKRYGHVGNFNFATNETLQYAILCKAGSKVWWNTSKNLACDYDESSDKVIARIDGTWHRDCTGLGIANYHFLYGFCGKNGYKRWLDYNTCAPNSGVSYIHDDLVCDRR